MSTGPDDEPSSHVVLPDDKDRYTQTGKTGKTELKPNTYIGTSEKDVVAEREKRAQKNQDEIFGKFDNPKPGERS